MLDEGAGMVEAASAGLEPNRPPEAAAPPKSPVDAGFEASAAGAAGTAAVVEGLDPKLNSPPAGGAAAGVVVPVAGALPNRPPDGAGVAGAVDEG